VKAKCKNYASSVDEISQAGYGINETAQQDTAKE